MILIRCAIFGLILLASARPAPTERISTADTPRISAGMFLIASGFYMTDPRFSQSVVLIVKHVPDKGTIGLILNHPTRMNVRQALPELASSAHLTLPLYIGGPVSPRDYFLLVRTNEAASNLESVISGVSFSSNLDSIGEWLGREAKSSRIRVFAGYSGWSPGQLATEIALRGWRLAPADAATVFDIAPEDIYMELVRRGIVIET